MSRHCTHIDVVASSMQEAQALVAKFERDIAWPKDCLPVFWEKAVAKVDVPVNKYDESIMDDGSSVCNANDDDYGKEHDGGTAILGLRETKGMTMMGQDRYDDSNFTNKSMSRCLSCLNPKTLHEML